MVKKKNKKSHLEEMTKVLSDACESAYKLGYLHGKSGQESLFKADTSNSSHNKQK